MFFMNAAHSLHKARGVSLLCCSQSPYRKHLVPTRLQKHRAANNSGIETSVLATGSPDFATVQHPGHTESTTMEEVQYLFDSAGEWIAFRKGKHLFARMGEWLGWFPWNDEEAVDPSGEYLGTIYLGDRLYRFSNHEYRGYPGRLENPGYPGYPGAPDRAEASAPPAAAYDIEIEV